MQVLEVEIIYAIILMLAFAGYLLYDYFTHRRNVYKLLFLIPILMSTLLMTSIPSTWDAKVFFAYRIILIGSVFVIMFLYTRDLLKRKNEQSKNITQRQKKLQADNRNEEKKKNNNKKKSGYK